MRNEPITKELREYVRLVRAYHLTDNHGKKREYVEATTTDLLEIADHIDEEYKNRLENSRYEMRRAVIHYLRGVLNDYEKGVKRVRKEKRQ